MQGIEHGAVRVIERQRDGVKLRGTEAVRPPEAGILDGDLLLEILALAVFFIAHHAEFVPDVHRLAARIGEIARGFFCERDGDIQRFSGGAGIRAACIGEGIARPASGVAGAHLRLQMQLCRAAVQRNRVEMRAGEVIFRQNLDAHGAPDAEDDEVAGGAVCIAADVPRHDLRLGARIMRRMAGIIGRGRRDLHDKLILAGLRPCGNLRDGAAEHALVADNLLAVEPDAAGVAHALEAEEHVLALDFRQREAAAEVPDLLVRPVIELGIGAEIGIGQDAGLLEAAIAGRGKVCGMRKIERRRRAFGGIVIAEAPRAVEGNAAGVPVDVEGVIRIHGEAPFGNILLISLYHPEAHLSIDFIL